MQNSELDLSMTQESTARPYCPHLGLQEDRTVMLIGPSQAHRCYAQPHPISPDSERQINFCLTRGHGGCPLYREPSILVLESAVAGSAVGAPQHYPLVLRSMPQAKPTVQGKHVLLPMRARPKKSAQRRGRSGGRLTNRGPLLLPAVSSYSAKRLHRWSYLSTKVTIFAVIFLVLVTVISGLFLRQDGTAFGRTYQLPGVIALVNPSPTATKTPMQPAVVITENTQPSAITNTLVVTTDVAPIAAVQPLAVERFVTPTPEPGGQVYNVIPGNNSVGWWMADDIRRNHLNDSFLYVGHSQGKQYIAAVRFDLRNVARGATLIYGQLRLTGLRDQSLADDPNVQWQAQLIAEDALPNLASADFLTLLSAPAVLNLPPLRSNQLANDEVNSWELDEEARTWIENQLLLGATSIILRLQVKDTGQENLFAWDSGFGPQTNGGGPVLILSAGPAPATPPVLPTRPFIVATLTPVPANVLTVVAQNSTATAVAVTTGTYTPVPYQVLTPTSFPENLATVQSVALDRGLPPVLLHTPTPANPAEATGFAQYATAVAVTTGTFTPEPADFVTPVMVIPSPPAENVATEAARFAEATAVAESGAPTPTPLPYNAVVAVYVYATPLPENAATAAAQSVIATAAAMVDGTPTPLAWNAIVITAMPTLRPPESPTPTPLPSLQPVTDFTPTPTATDSFMPDTMPELYRNKIIFRTNRSGREETYALDPYTNELFRVNEGWVHTLAYNQLSRSPDRSKQVVVREDSNRVLQIQIMDLVYGGIRQITTLKNISYDPAWSPQGDKIVFVSKDSGNDEIYTVTADGSIIQKLTSRSNSWDKHPSFSPDGSQIVFFSNRDTGRRQLWIMNADGSNQRSLSNNDYEDWDPIWVP